MAANPNGAHRVAREARRALDRARAAVADALGGDAGELVFCSGGTEADNLAVLGTLDAVGGIAVCSAVEHPAVLEAVRSRDGRVVGVDERGVIDLEALADALDDRVSVVSVMTVNNEVGSIQPLTDVAAIVRERAPGAVFHTDAVQGLPWLDVAKAAADADLVSVSGHKVGAPVGVGALLVRGAADPWARQIGGGQERGRRSGTQAVALAAAMAAAVEATVAERDDTVARVRRLRDRLADGLVASVDGLVETGCSQGRDHKVAGACHVCVPGLDSESLLFLLDERDVCASAASACASGAHTSSHVLAAMGVDASLAAGALRLTLGHTTTDADIDHAIGAIGAAVERLRLFA